MEKTVKWFAAAAGAVAGLFMRMPIAVRLLVLLMGLDYLSGVGVALLGKSPKSEGGALSSRAGFAGLMRKAMILIVILLAAVRGLHRRGGDVLYRQRVAFHSGKRGAARRACAAEADAGARCGQMDVKFRKRGAPKRKAGRINPAKAA